MEGLIYPRGAYTVTLKQAKQWQCLSKYVLHFNAGF